MLIPRRGPVLEGSGRPRDAGTSLVEVLVAMVIAVVVGSMMVLYLLSAVHNTRRADGQNEQAAGARTVLDSWSALVPYAVDPAGQSAAGAVRFYSIAPQSVKFCAALGTKSSNPLISDPAPVGVELALVGTQLVERRWTSCAAMVAGATSVRRILVPHGTLAAPGAWLLTPLAAADLPLTGVAAGPLTSSLTTGQTPLNAILQADALKIGQISSLQLSFKTSAAPGRPAPAASYSMLLGLSSGG